MKSWRRKYFYNERSWQRYIYYTKLLCKLNESLRSGMYLKTSHMRVIHSSWRYGFTLNRKPHLGIFKDDEFEDLGDISYKNDKIYISLDIKEIYDKFRLYRKYKLNGECVGMLFKTKPNQYE